jgi:hypothetical protein
VTAAAYAVLGMVLAGCGAYALSVLPGHQPGCLRRTIGIHALIGWTLACIAAVYAWRIVRHPVWHAQYLAVRVIRRHPRRYPDGEPLDPDEMCAHVGITWSWRQPAVPEPERTRT